jgi:hypothetical protein
MKKQNKNKLAFNKANVTELTNNALLKVLGGKIDIEAICTGNTLSSCDTGKV